MKYEKQTFIRCKILTGYIVLMAVIGNMAAIPV